MAQKEKIKKALFESNPWWRKKLKINYKDRDIYQKLQKYIDAKQIIALTGLRRVGKTVLMHHIIDYLLKIKISPNNIVYFNFDLSKESIEEILKEYKEITNVDYKKENIFVFLDEIQLKQELSIVLCLLGAWNLIRWSG